MKNLFIVLLAIVGTSLSAATYAAQSEDKVAMMELERDFIALANESKRQSKKKEAASNSDDEPDCD